MRLHAASAFIACRPLGRAQRSVHVLVVLVAFLVLLMRAPVAHAHAWACGSDAARAAIVQPAVAGKFIHAAGLCADEDLAGALPLPRRRPARPPAPVRAPVWSVAWVDRSAQQPPRSGIPFAVAIREPLRLTPPARSAEPTLAASRPAAAGVSRSAAARGLALAPQIRQVADRYRIDPLLLHAIAYVESRNNPQAVSPAGALGLMQVMPATARRFGVAAPHSQLHDPITSLEVGSAYLKNLQARFDNDLSLVLAAYNAGEGAVEKYGRRIPPYAETREYVRRVLAHYDMLRRAAAGVVPDAAAPHGGGL